MDARTSRYHEVYARWQRDPEGVLGRSRGRASTGTSRRRRSSIRIAGVYGRWFVGGVCNTCWNAVDRHVAAAATIRRR